MTFNRLELTELLFEQFFIIGTVSKINKKYFLLTNIKRDNKIEILTDHNWFNIHKKDKFVLNQLVKLPVRVFRYKKGYKLIRL